MYGFIDATGAGFGSLVERPGNRQRPGDRAFDGMGPNNAKVRVRYGLWGKDMKGSSSNLRELRNLVETVEDEVKNGAMRDTELFIFTDNCLAESAFYNGTSSSKLLFELVLRLRLLEMEGGLRLHVVHVAGTRMQAQGTDGLSRGSLMEGIMAGHTMMEFVLLAETALERLADVLPWLESWWKGARVLTPAQWFWEGHGIVGGHRNEEGIWVPETVERRSYVWALPPTVAGVAVEELIKARHKRPFSSHVFVCSRLFTHAWQKRLFKTADIVLTIPPGAPFWLKEMFEPLILAICLPLSTRRPWGMRQSCSLLAMEGQLHAVWKGESGIAGAILHKFLKSAQRS